MDTIPAVTVAPVKSAFLSKINWTQAVAVLASATAIFGLNLDTQTQVYIVGAITLAQSTITWVLRTWFTNSITQESLPIQNKETT